jgi:uncharacterized membrane protein
VSDLVFISFPNEEQAEAVRDKLLDLQKEYLIELGDAVIAVKDEKGRVKLNQLLNTTAAGALSGAFWGTLVGFLFMVPCSEQRWALCRAPSPASSATSASTTRL